MQLMHLKQSSDQGGLYSFANFDVQKGMKILELFQDFMLQYLYLFIHL